MRCVKNMMEWQKVYTQIRLLLKKQSSGFTLFADTYQFISKYLSKPSQVELYKYISRYFTLSFGLADEILVQITYAVNLINMHT